MEAGEPSDAVLVARARGGDAAAFESLVKRHIRAALGVALAVLGEFPDADDAVQDALLSAMQHLESCAPAEKFRAWLLTIVRNRAFDLKRRGRVRSVDLLEEGTAQTRAESNGGVCCTCAPAETIAAAAQASVMWRARGVKSNIDIFLLMRTNITAARGARRLLLHAESGACV